MTDRDSGRSCPPGRRGCVRRAPCAATRSASTAPVARILCDDSEAWDVVQMAFLKAWNDSDRYDPKWSFATGCTRIGSNVAIDLLSLPTQPGEDPPGRAEHHLRLVGEPCPTGELAEATTSRRWSARCSEDLSPQQRSAFVLRELEGLDSSEVATILGCSSTTVRNHVFPGPQGPAPGDAEAVPRVPAARRER